jgi:hypothetical protein
MVTRIKLALAIIGIIVFAAGVRLEHTVLRWVGIGFVAAAFLARFVKPRP